MGKASDWLGRSVARTLGDWVAFCLGCGHVQRYFAEDEAELPAACPTCGGELRVRCPPAGADRLGLRRHVRGVRRRAATRRAFGGPIRKPPRAPKYT